MVLQRKEGEHVDSILLETTAAHFQKDTDASAGKGEIIIITAGKCLGATLQITEMYLVLEG